MPRTRKEKDRTPIRTLHWVPAKRLKRAYELYETDETLGRIRWPKLFGSLAEAEFKGHRWTFKRGGFLRPRVTVREGTSDADFAVMELSWGGSGQMRMSDGSRFTWGRKGFWSHRFTFANENGVELIGFEPTFGLVRRSGTVTISPEASKLPQLGMLVMLGWYVIMLIADDEAATVVICCS